MINIYKSIYARRSWNDYKYFLIQFFICMNLAGSSLAGSFYVNPVKIELSEKKQTAVISIENTSENDTSIQIKPMSWSQKNGEEILKITKDILVTPKIFKIKSGTTQIVRVGMMVNAEKNEELSYRLSFEEIPPPPDPDFKGLQIALRINIPLFISPIDPVLQEINFSNFTFLNEKISFNIKNLGSAHTKIISTRLYSEENPEKIIGIYESPIYILPKSEKSIAIKVDQLNSKNWSRIKIKAHTLTELIESDAILSKP